MGLKTCLNVPLFGSIVVCFNLFISTTAQTTTTTVNPGPVSCEEAGGECMGLPCRLGEIPNAECYGRMFCCRKEDDDEGTPPDITLQSTPSTTRSPPGDGTEECDDASGMCMISCLPSDEEVPGVECPMEGKCCRNRKGPEPNTTTSRS